MNNYWSCSKFADWLRGTSAPVAFLLSGVDEMMERQEDWQARAQAAHPVRYWLAETGLDWLQNIVLLFPDKRHSLKCYLKNRYWTKPHIIRTEVPPGRWLEYDDRIFYGAFAVLEEYVKDRKPDWFVWAVSQRDEEGELTHQAKISLEVQAIHTWWTIERPKRKAELAAVKDHRDYGWLSNMLITDHEKMFDRLLAIRKELWI